MRWARLRRAVTGGLGDWLTGLFERAKGSAPCDALPVAVVVLASAEDLLLNDFVTIPVLAAVCHSHRGVAPAVLVVSAVPLVGVVRRRLPIL